MRQSCPVREQNLTEPDHQSYVTGGIVVVIVTGSGGQSFGDEIVGECTRWIVAVVGFAAEVEVIETDSML